MAGCCVHRLCGKWASNCHVVECGWTAGGSRITFTTVYDGRVQLSTTPISSAHAQTGSGNNAGRSRAPVDSTDGRTWLNWTPQITRAMAAFRLARGTVRHRGWYGPSRRWPQLYSSHANCPLARTCQSEVTRSSATATEHLLVLGHAVGRRL